MIWSRDERWKSLLVATEGVEMIDGARRSGRGVLLLVPHFGNWEILNLFLGAHCGLTALYDPPRVRGLDPISSRGSRAHRKRLASGDGSVAFEDCT